MTDETCDRCGCDLTQDETDLGWPIAMPSDSDPEAIEYVCPSCYGDEAYDENGEVLSATEG